MDSNDNAVWIDGSQGKLYALLELPDLAANAKCPLVILCHGFRGSLDFHLWAPLSETLNSRGIGVLRFDFNGLGKSEGSFQNMTIINEIEDLMNVISYAATLDSVKNISLVGHSQGGVVCGMAAGTCGSGQIKSLVLLSAAAVLRDDSLRGITMGAHFNPWHLDKPFYEIDGGLKLGRAYIQSAMNLPIYETTAKYDGPVLIMNGMADQIVPYTYGLHYKEILPQAELVIAPGENHPWTVAPEKAVELMASWLSTQLAGGREYAGTLA